MRFTNFFCRVSPLKRLLNQLTRGGVKNLPARFNNSTCVAFAPLNHFSLFLCHRVRIFCFKLRVPRVLIIHVEWVAKPGSLHTSLKWVCLRTFNISADKICTNWRILAFLELESSQAFCACCCAQNIVALIHVFGFLSFYLWGFWLGKFDWTYQVTFTMLVKCCVSRILRISSSLFDLVSFWTSHVFVMERVISCWPVFSSWDGTCSCYVTNI